MGTIILNASLFAQRALLSSKDCNLGEFVCVETTNMLESRSVRDVHMKQALEFTEIFVIIVLLLFGVRVLQVGWS